MGEKQPSLLEYKIVAGRTRVEKAVDSRAIKTTVKALKDRGSIRIFKAPKLDTGNLVATHRPPFKGNPIDVSKVLLGIYGNLHNDTGDPRTKDV